MSAPSPSNLRKLNAAAIARERAGKRLDRALERLYAAYLDRNRSLFQKLYAVCERLDAALCRALDWEGVCERSCPGVLWDCYAGRYVLAGQGVL